MGTAKRTSREATVRARKKMGERISARRRELGLSKELLAAMMREAGAGAVTRSDIHHWEKGERYGPIRWRWPVLADCLKCSVPWLGNGKEPSLLVPGASAPDTSIGTLRGSPHGADTFSGKVVEAIGRPIEEHREMCPVIIDNMSRIEEISHEELQSIARVTSGAELIYANRTLDDMIALLQPAFERSGHLGAARLLFEACDKAVQLTDFVTPPAMLLQRTERYLGIAARVAILDSTNQRRFRARYGDLVKIAADGDKPSIEHAHKILLAAADPSGASEHDPYCLVRSLVITAGLVCTSDEEFNVCVKGAEHFIDTSQCSLHVKAHVRDGIAEGYARRFKRTHTQKYARLAVKHLIQAEQLGKTAAEKEGMHGIYGLRLDKMPLVLAQLEVFEPLGTTEKGRAYEIMSRASRIAQRAKADGVERTYEQMTEVIMSTVK